MVGRGVVWASGLAIGVSFVACGGRSANSNVSDGGEAGEESTGGRTSMGGRSSAGTGTAGAPPIGGTAGGVAVGGTAGGVAVGGTAGSVSIGGNGGAGVPQGGTSGVDTCSSQGGWTGADGCSIPWWGTPLDGVKGLLSCPAPDDPALLAYSQINFPPCIRIVGPLGGITGSDGGIACCYQYDDRACCGGTFVPDRCLEIPYFGRGDITVSLPTRPIEDPGPACGRSFGEPLDLARSEAAERMIGIWIACEALPAPFLGDGFIFRGDGTFHAIELDDELRLSESEGCMQGGLWGFFGLNGQMNLHIGDSTQFVFPTFTSGPEERLVVDSIPFVRAIYAADL